MCYVTYKRFKLLSTAYSWNVGCIFQQFDRIYPKKVVPKHNENHSLAWVNMWGTSTNQSTTTLCMQSQQTVYAEPTYTHFFLLKFASPHA